MPGIIFLQLYTPYEAQIIYLNSRYSICLTTERTYAQCSEKYLYLTCSNFLMRVSMAVRKRNNDFLS